MSNWVCNSCHWVNTNQFSYCSNCRHRLGIQSENVSRIIDRSPDRALKRDRTASTVTYQTTSRGLPWEVDTYAGSIK